LLVVVVAADFTGSQQVIVCIYQLSVRTLDIIEEEKKNTNIMSEEQQQQQPPPQAAADTASSPPGQVVIDAVATTAMTEEEILEMNGGFRVYTMNNLTDQNDYKNLDCRFYENVYPEIESVVMVNVRNIADMGAYVTLLEYNHIEGMILLSELSRRRIRSIHKLIRVNRNEVVMVLRVDQEKGYIDLSKRRVSAEDIIACEERYNKAKAVHGVLRHIAEKHRFYLQELYERIGWPLYKKYGHAFDAFKLAIQAETDNSTKIDDPFLELDSKIPVTLIQEIKAYILRKLAPQPIKIRSDIEVSCFSYEGIDAIREALIAGTKVTLPSGIEENNANETTETAIVSAQPQLQQHTPIKIKLIAPPIYVLSITTLDKEAGIALLYVAIDTIRTIITSKGGKLDIKMAPKAVSDKEENELQAMMDRLALENEEVDGDAPEDD
jgi:translation initiation factor 2 subunit 1